MLSADTKKAIQGAYSQFLAAKQLKPRYGQKLMIADIAKTLGNITVNDDGSSQGSPNVAVVEAGTGTGKTIAYLLSTLPIAKQLEKRVVLSTATVALQEQIIIKDLPELLRHSGLEFSFVLAKGRSRYVCLTKLENILSDAQSGDAALFEDEAVYIPKGDLSVYRSMLQKTADGEWDGDRDSWKDSFETDVWQRVTTDHRQCTGRKCPNIRDCAFYNARNALEEADCIVANHDLVLADLALGGGAILPAPEETIYIFDEGHHLPEKTLNHFAATTRYRGTLRWLGQSEGQWPNFQKTVSELSYFNQLAEPLTAYFQAARSALELHLPAVRLLCEQVDIEKPSPKIQFTRGEVGADVEQLARDITDAFLPLQQLLDKLFREIDTLINEESGAVPRSELEAMHRILGTWLSRADANVSLWQSYRQTEFNVSQPYARWISILTNQEPIDYEWVSSPVMASTILQKGLWERCCGAVVTSATLRALNSFDRFLMRAGLGENAYCQAFPSPFDFANNGTIHVPKNAVEANRSIEHTEYLISYLPELIQPSEATLVLFGSHYQMRQVYEALPESLLDIVQCQGQQSKQHIIDSHKQRIDQGEGSVIWGLASFAEGVDLPGVYCAHVIIAKLPFSVPDEPLEAAFSEWIEAKGGNAFMEVTVPDASTRLIQACGRLLRTETDTGRVTILDERLRTKRYGRALLDSLPPFRRDI